MLRTTPKFSKNAPTRVKLTPETELIGLSSHEVSVIKDFARDGDEEAISRISSQTPIPENLAMLIESESGLAFTRKKGAFVITLEGSDITVYSDEDEGRQNGIMTLLQSLDSNATYKDAILYDYPIAPIRGMKILMPGHDEMEEFKKAIDTLVFFRHNTLMLEIGGAMEYKRHPEINEGWVEYCAFMSEYSGKTIDLQERTYPWRKNSIHCNNGKGSFLAQEEVRELVRYCEERNVTIIPEVPSTSHCDYMLIRHPELAERCEDPYPDTFCPSNPDSYKLLFDILDEVIDVFHPDIINIGHDEYYSINVCDRCRKRILSNADIFAEDVCRIHSYLAEKGVKTMLWCDKLMNVTEDQGYGGALSYIYFEWDPSKDLLAVLRPTWEARFKIPKDVICLNWYHSFPEKYDDEIRDFPMVFGNFTGRNMRGFRRRLGENGFGGIASNWGGVSDVYFRRNNVYSSVVYNESLFWDSSYNDSSDEEYAERTDRAFRALFGYRYRRDLGKNGALIEVIHTTDAEIPYRHFVDGVFPEGKEFDSKYLAGEYTVTLEDGESFTHRVVYGENLISSATPWYGIENKAAATTDAPGVRKARINITLSSLSGEVIPEYRDGKTICKIYIRNPHTEKRVSSVTLTKENESIKLELLKVTPL